MTLLHEVEDWEKEDPDKVNEVPEQASDLDTVSKPLGLLFDTSYVRRRGSSRALRLRR